MGAILARSPRAAALASKGADLGIVPWCLDCGIPEHDWDVDWELEPDPLIAPDRFVEESLKMCVMGVE